jgi:hypothetical protein
MVVYVHKFAKMPLDTDRYATEIQDFIDSLTFTTLESMDIEEMGAQFIVTVIVTP